MRLFRVEDNNLTIYKQKLFKNSNTEEILENWFENQDDTIFEDEKVLIIGRQITTNLGKAIDLLGVDKIGNTVIIELKRDKTPRDTIAQILEYASFVEDLSYEKIENIAKKYNNDENYNLSENHKNLFELDSNTPVAFNKDQRLVIIGHDIAKEIKQTSLLLNKKGFNVYCLEFNYFTTDEGKQIITSGFVVSKEMIGEGGEPISLPKINKKIFISSVDDYTKDFFELIFNSAQKNNMPVHWGSKGFSLNVDLGGNHVNILYGYSKKAGVGQSIYTAVQEIRRKVNNAEEIVNSYFEKLNNTNLFIPAGHEIKWIINKPVSKENIDIIVQAIDNVRNNIVKEGLKK